MILTFVRLQAYKGVMWITNAKTRASARQAEETAEKTHDRKAAEAWHKIAEACRALAKSVTGFKL